MGSSWSYAEQEASASELAEKPTPPEVVETLECHSKWGQRLRDTIRGDISQTPTDNPVKETAFLVKYIKKATHEEGSQPPAVMETMAYIAQMWPTNDRGQSRWWTRDEQGKFDDARAYVFSEETDPETFFEAPTGAEKRWRQQEQEADKHEAQVKAAFWECIQDAKGGMVFAHHGDVAACPNVEVSEERARQLLHDWEAVKQVDDPRGTGPAGLNSRSVFAVVDE